VCKTVDIIIPSSKAHPNACCINQTNNDKVAVLMREPSPAKPAGDVHCLSCCGRDHCGQLIGFPSEATLGALSQARFKAFSALILSFPNHTPPLSCSWTLYIQQSFFSSYRAAFTYTTISGKSGASSLATFSHTASPFSNLCGYYRSISSVQFCTSASCLTFFFLPFGT
jgi:hypothetical protein